MKLLNILLLPFSFAYGLITFIRNKLYDLGLLKEHLFDKPIIISVGNLSVGGTGKSPHIEYLIRLLKDKYTVATLSRGYGRKTSGFLLVKESHDASEVGDEPLQFKSRHPEISVAVDESRARGIRELQKRFPELEVVLLDDAFQHRSVKPNLSVLLTDYNRLFYNDKMLPSGRLREYRSGYKRADILIVTKCPSTISPIEKETIVKEIKPKSYQKIFFSHINYGEFQPIKNSLRTPIINKEYTSFLFTGIANPSLLEAYLQDHFLNVVPLTFPDHHQFSPKDIKKLQETFKSVPSDKKIIITTEKDTMRLKAPLLKELTKELPLFYIPIEVSLSPEDKKELLERIYEIKQ